MLVARSSETITGGTVKLGEQVHAHLWWTYDVIKPPFWIFWRPSWIFDDIGKKSLKS